MPSVQIPETRYATTPDGNVAYQSFGDGPYDVLWIPDWHNPIEILWEEPRVQRFFSELARYSRVILFDKRGTGLQFADRGTHTLKGVPDAWQLFALVDAATPFS